MVIKTAFLLFAGPLLTYRALKQSGPCGRGGIANSEFSNAMNDLEESGLGKARSVLVRFSSNPVTVFVKEDPDKVAWPTDYCSQTEYHSHYNQPTNKSISVAIKCALIDAQFIPEDMCVNMLG